MGARAISRRVSQGEAQSRLAPDPRGSSPRSGAGLQRREPGHSRLQSVSMSENTSRYPDSTSGTKRLYQVFHSGSAIPLPTALS
jgi:hypothetical protein